jgi:2-dehydropantoate 2-reductase
VKICILGAGALGSALGGALAEACADVTLICRPAHAEAINTSGLRVIDDAGERTVRVAARADCNGLEPVDLVIVLVKSFDTHEALRSAREAVGPNTLVMSLQNGLGHEETISEFVDRERILAGKTYAGGVLLSPGRVRVGLRGKETIIGELDGSVTPRVLRIAEVFRNAQLTIEVSADIRAVIWDKLLINIAGGALTAITRLTYGGLYSSAVLERCSLAAIAEAMAVAGAKGVRLATKDPREAFVKAGVGLPLEFKSSMLQSLEKGSRTEIDFVNGAVVSAGDAAGVPTPVNSTLVACVKGIELAMSDYPGKA